MNRCTAIQQGYPQIGQSCSRLPHTGFDLGLAFTLALCLLVVGYVLFRIGRSRA